MNKAQELRKRFEEDLADLQTWCEHNESEILPYMWAPGHQCGSVKVCKECEKVLDYIAEHVDFIITTSA